MENIKEAMKKMGVVPKLRLGIRLVQPNGKPGGVKSTGPHKVKFLEEPTLVMGKDFEGKPVKQFKCLVEENGKKYRWMVPILNKEGQANYLLERLEDVEVGDTRILEMLKRGAANYIDVRGEDELTSDEVPEGADYEDEEQEELQRALAKEKGE